MRKAVDKCFPKNDQSIYRNHGRLSAPRLELRLFGLTLILIASILLSGLTQIVSAAERSELRIFKAALPGYRFKFPADHYAHNEYRTEWWYYTGHLQAAGGKEFGFELTFFRSGVPIEDGVKEAPWALQNVYMTHFALSDLSGKKFFHKEKICRAGVASAGASDSEYKVWTENWSVKQDGNRHLLVARDKDMAIDLVLDEGKSPVIQGENGVSQKASCVGCASHYYSQTRMPARGNITVEGRNFDVKGIAWMDHEFGSNQLGADQIGWDWYSIQLDDNSELMLYVMRLRNGKNDPNSSATIISPDAKSEHLPLSKYQVQASAEWKSPHTGGKYPSKWRISIPSRNIVLDIEPLLADQELVSRAGGISYWEGACRVSGSKGGKAVSGKAYVELTGYAKELNKNI